MRFMGLKQIVAACMFLNLLCWAAPAGDAQPDKETIFKAIKEKVASLQYQTGSVTLPGGVATVNLPAELKFADTANSRKILEDIWGNPPGQEVLGMLVPADFNPIGDSGWGVVITFREDGYVKDDDAEKINYSDLLKQMQEETREASKERAKEGYGTVELVGWATAPRYDKQTHKMYWAKELKFGGGEQNTLNYNIRVLGRKGVLVLNAVAGMDQLEMVEKAAPALISAVDFTQGNRYADFNASSDKVAEYGLAALVAGGVAAKAGLFKGLWLVLLAAKKFVIIGVIAVIAVIAKVFKKKV